MSSKPTAVKKAPTRDEIRAALIGSRPPGDSRMIELWGMEIELRQPTLEAILKTRDTGSTVERAVDMIIEYAYVPGTDDHVFEDTDKPQILRWPFGKDLQKLNEAIAELTGVDIETAVKELEKDPLGGSS